jgi:hypothetical protein
MKSVTPVILAGFVFASVLAQASAQSERERIDVSVRGPQVGDPIPDFALQDQFGRTWTRDEILGENGTMLVFIRSADW